MSATEKPKEPIYDRVWLDGALSRATVALMHKLTSTKQWSCWEMAEAAVLAALQESPARADRCASTRRARGGRTTATKESEVQLRELHSRFESVVLRCRNGGGYRITCYPLPYRNVAGIRQMAPTTAAAIDAAWHDMMTVPPCLWETQ